MSSLGSIMDTSLSAMFSARVALGTVSHNIANVNTPGYSRQEVLLGARRPNVMTYGILGRGVEVQGIRRMTDEFLLANHRLQTSRLASYEQVDFALTEIEAMFGSVDNDHLGDAMNEFFNAWSSLATPPSDTSLKIQVRSAATALVDDFHSMAAALDDLQQSIETTIAGEIRNLNDLLEQVAALNGQILNAAGSGAEANDLLDQRDLLVSKISELAKVNTIEREDGTLDVIIAGRTMVTRDQFEQMDRIWVDEGDGRRLYVVNAKTRKRVELSDGKIEGLFTARDEYVDATRDRLDEMATIVIERVNELHVQGRSAGSTGLPFFTGDSAETIGISSAILEDAGRIATSRSGLDGDNDLALEIADLPITSLDAAGGETLNDHYRSIIIDLASQRGRFQFMLENQESVVDAVESRLASARGVSLDEEGSNLMRFQNAYDAAARVITVVQEMFQTLIEM
jgi:flagellar hook-associated protein 1 FlgK